MVRKLPVHLFCNLKSQGFGTLRVVRPKVNVHKTPTILISNLSTEPVNLIIVSLKRNHSRATKERGSNFSWFDVIWNKYKTLQTCCCTVSCQSIPQIPRRSAGKDLKPKFNAPTNRHWDNPIFVRKGRTISRIILKIEFGKPKIFAQSTSVNQRSPTRIITCNRSVSYRKKLSISPQIEWSRRNFISINIASNFFIVISDL